jgi:cell wall-associated NlpC family hydrolase
VSVVDDFRTAEQRVAQRLKELEPAVAEYRELEEVAQRLGIDPRAAAASPAAPRSRTRRKATGRRAASTTSRATGPAKAAGRRSRSKARRGQRGEQLIELVRTRPGITVRDAGKELGVDPTGLYRVVHRLEQGGQLRKNGRVLELGAGAAEK